MDVVVNSDTIEIITSSSQAGVIVLGMQQSLFDPDKHNPPQKNNPARSGAIVYVVVFVWCFDSELLLHSSKIRTNRAGPETWITPLY